MKSKTSFFSLIIFVLFWQILSLFVDRPLLPSFLETLFSLFEMIKSGEILGHFWISFYRVILSIIISLIISLPLGIFIGYNDWAYGIFYPLVTSLYPMPKVVFLPVLVLFLGLGNLSKIFLISLILIFQLQISIIDSVRNIPKEAYISMYSLTQSFKNMLIHLILPFILPDLLTSLRICIGTAISVLFFSETFASFDGLGYYILDAMGRREYKQMYAIIIIMSLMGLILYKFLFLIEKRTCHWKNNKL